jgi:hypothetical protein
MQKKANKMKEVIFDYPVEMSPHPCKDSELTMENLFT